MSKSFFTVISTLFCVLSLYSQNNNVVNYAPKLNVPTSPEAAMLGKFGDIPIGYYTGTANVSIPLYNLSVGDKNIPISLDYHSSGIKVKEDATWVGLGWNMAPEGTIIQEVRGRKDQVDDNIRKSTNPAKYDMFKARFNTLPMGSYKLIKQIGIAGLHWCTSQNPWQDNGYSDPEFIILGLLEGSGQPDIYRYNFDGYSGSFYINPDTRQPVLLDKPDNIKFTVIPDVIIATTSKGDKYTFGAYEKASTVQTDAHKYSGGTYKLSNIQYAEGKEVSFGYQLGRQTSKVYSQNSSMNFVCYPAPVPENVPVMTYTENEVQKLTYIVTSKDSIRFNTGARTDIFYLQYGNQDYTGKLESIDIYSRISKKKVKSFLFTYSYFDSALQSVSSTNETRRLRLDLVKEVGYDVNSVQDLSKPPYVFTYNTVQLPPKTSFNQDFWGYYNGPRGNTGLLPDLDFFEYNYEPNYTDNSVPNRQRWDYNYNKNYRYTDNIYAGACMLQNIKYPTGGYTDFTFEPHAFTNQFIPNQAQFSTIKKIKSVVKNYPSCPTCEQTGEILINKPSILDIHISFFHGFPQVSGQVDTGVIAKIYNNSYVSILRNGIEIKRWVPYNFLPVNIDPLNGLPYFTTNGTLTGDVKYRVDYQPGVVYKVVAHFPDPCSTNDSCYNSPSSSCNCITNPGQYWTQQHNQGTSADVRYYSTVNFDTSVSYGGGLRVSRIKNYTSAGILASDKEILYINEDGKSSGKILNRFTPLELIESFCTTCGGAANGTSGNIMTPFKQINVSADDFGMSGGTTIAYDRVIEIEHSTLDAATMGKKIYTYDNFINLTRKGFDNVVNPFNGKIKREEFRDTTDKLLLEKIYSYENQIGPSSFDAIKIINHCYGQSDMTDGYPDVDNEPYKYSYETTPLDSHFYKSKSVTTNTYIDGNPNNKVSQVETYEYEPILKNTRNILTTSSSGETLKTTYYYFPDFSIDATATSIPIKTEQYRDATLLSSTRYDSWPPMNIFTKKFATATEETRASIRYRNNGDVIQYILDGGTPMSIIYGYGGTVPVAKIEGISYQLIPAGLITNIESASSSTGSEALLQTALLSLRNSPVLARTMITTYTYKPGIGVSTITDPRGLTTTYEYDNFGRLYRVKDYQGNILNENTYHFRP